MSTNQRIAWQMWVQCCLLLVLYAAVSLLTAIKFLAVDPLAVSLPYMQVAGFSHILLDAALLTGVLAAAVYMLQEQPSSLLPRLYQAWTILLVLIVLAGLAGVLEGRHRLELPLVLDAVLLVLLLAWLLVVWQSPTTIGKDLYLAGLVLLILGYGASLIPLDNPLSDRYLRVLMVNARYFVAYPLCGLALVYWLKPELPVYQAGAALAVWGGLVSIAPLTATDAIGANALPALIVLGLALYWWQFLATDDRWLLVGLSFLWVSLGGLGVIFALPVFGKHLLGTQLSEIQLEMAAWAVLLVVFAFMNRQSQTQNWQFRFWLIAGGLSIAGVALGLAGVVQVFMERILSIGYLDTQYLIQPLYAFWIVGLLIGALGIGLHTVSIVQQRRHLQ